MPSIRTLAFTALMLAGFGLCSCRTSHFAQWPAGSGRARGRDWSTAEGRRGGPRNERFGFKVMCERAGGYRSIQHVPIAPVLSMRVYSDVQPQIMEYSLGFYHGTYRYSEVGIKRRIRTDTIKVMCSWLWPEDNGLYGGVGLGCRIGEIKIKDTDWYWTPPEVYRRQPFVFDVLGQLKLGYDTGEGFYVEVAGTIGLGYHPSMLSVDLMLSAELGVGFYY